MCVWLGGAGGCVLSGPWRLTEPCDVTIGGATWLDQAQETAARTNQNAGPHRKKAGQQRATPISQGWGGAGSIRVGWGGEGGKRQLQIHTEKEQDQTTVHQQQQENVHSGPERKRRCKERREARERRS